MSKRRCLKIADLQSFLPLEKSFMKLRFTNTDLEGDTEMLNKLRAMRIIELGQSLAQLVVNGATLISVTASDENGEQKFTPACEGTGLSNEINERIGRIKFEQRKTTIIANSPVPSETASSKGSSEVDSLIAELGLEKRGGILKPQGSLERNRDSSDIVTVENNSQPLSARKPRQNVAMQAIMRRAESEQKQVTFKNVSPEIVKSEKKSNSDIAIHNTNTISQSVKTSNVKNIAITTAITNGINSTNITTTIDASVNQPRQPLLTNAPVNVQKTSAPPHLQLEQLKLEKRINNVLPQQSQQRENVLSSTGVGQYQMADLRAPNQVSSAQNLSHFTQSQQQHQQLQLQQQQTSLSQNTMYQNQSFNVQTPQFNKNFMVNPAGSLQQYNVTSAMSVQFGNSQTPSNQAIPYPPGVNVNPGRLIQQTQPQTQQRNNFTSMPSGNPLITTSLNLASSQQPQQSIGQNIGLGIQQNPLSLHPQNLLPNAHRPVNGLGLQNHMGIPSVPATANMAAAYQNSLPENAITNSVVSNVQQQMNLIGPGYSQNNYGQYQPQPQNQISPSSYNGQQQKFNFTNQTNISKGQQQVPLNNYPMFQGYDTKDYNPWKDPQPPQPPMTWWGNSTMTSQIMQGKAKDIPINNDAFQNWANSSGLNNQRLNNMPLQPSNNYQQNPHQGRLYNGRNNFEEMRNFDMDQKQPQQAQSGNIYTLFSGNSWSGNGHLASGASISSANQQDQMKPRMNHQQSLWSGPGPSPLERLLEQQKSLREGGT